MIRFSENIHMLAIQRLPIVVVDYHIDKGEGCVVEEYLLFCVVLNSNTH